jgi:Domain of unknown function (DUF4203)
MLPGIYELPGAILLIFGGLLACLAGHRLFKVVLGVYGFIFGALIASSTMGTSSTLGMVLLALAGGFVGSVLLVVAWFVGVAIVGAGLAVLAAHLMWSQLGTGDPPPIAVIVVSVMGAIVAMLLQRYVIIIGTAFGGAWTVIVGGVNAMAARAGRRPASGDNVWIPYPLTPATDNKWVPLAWAVLGLVGAIVQLRYTSRKR